MKTSVLEITPDIANEMLSRNTENFRRINTARVMKYADEMKRGKWVFCADPIRFGISGKLIDGQHRLSAIVRSGVCVTCLVVEGLDDAASIAVDRGQPRSNQSWLAHKHVPNAKLVAAMSRLIVMHRSGKWAQTSFDSTDSGVLSVAEDNNETIQDALRTARVQDGVTYIPLTLLAAVMHEAAWPSLSSQQEKCVWFCESLKSGIGYKKEDAVYHLRERFINPKGDRLHASKKESVYTMRLLVTIAWNKTAYDDPCKILRFTTTGPGATEPPKVIAHATDRTFPRVF